MLLDTDGPFPSLAVSFRAAFDSGAAHRSLLSYGGLEPSALGAPLLRCRIRAPMSESEKKATTVSRINLIIHYQWQAFVLGMFAKGVW